MRLLAPSLCVLLAVAAAPAEGRRAKPVRVAGPRLLAGSRQLVLVTARDFSSTTGELRRYERARAGGPWRPVGARVPVDLGRSGLAWGLGLHGAAPAEPVKREGDGRSPAGAFRLSAVFGYAPSMARAKLPYVVATPTLECVDDPASAHYNRLVDRKLVAPDWHSSEHMLRPDGLYRVGVFVDHDVDPAVANAGSCIFLHIWSGPGVGTSGCTAMPAPAIESIAAWLDPSANPVLVQLPEPEYKRLRRAWGLP